MENENILEFRNVTIKSRAPYESGISEISFALKGGELALISVEKGCRHFPLADAAQGLIEPEEGRVTFLGRDWRDLDPDFASAERGRIGRVFETAGWVSNLNVDENVTISQRHHTDRPVGEIVEEAEETARFFGLPELPKGRPFGLNRSTRRKAEWVRAFIGDPLLIILEYPLSDLYTEELDYLLKGVEKARQRGSAVLWLTDDFRPQRAGLLIPTYRYQLKNEKLIIAYSKRVRAGNPKS